MFSEGLPLDAPVVNRSSKSAAKNWEATEADSAVILSGLGIALMVSVFLFIVGGMIRGPDFVIGYAAFAVCVTMAQWYVRRERGDFWIYSVVAAVMLAMVGLARIISGSLFFEMHRYSYLAGEMVIAIILQFIRMESLNFGLGRHGGCSSWFGGGSSCSSGAGGGCGGGGGGCGGCGG